MKKVYNTPELTAHGSIESITQAFGSSGRNDTFQNSKGQSFPGSLIGESGSIDGIVIPTE